MSLRDNLSIFDSFGLFAVLIAVIYRPLSVWILHIDGAGRIPFILLIISTITLLPKIWNSIIRKPFIFYFLLCVFQFLNGLNKGSILNYEQDGLYLFSTHIFLPFLASILVYNTAKRNFDFTLRICTYGLFAYSLICFIGGGILSNIDRTEYDINANELALYCAISVGLFILCYIRNLFRWQYLLLSIFPLTCIVISASRMGFAMVAMMFVGLWYVKLSRSRHSVKSLIKSSGLLLLFVLGMYYMMNNTEVGERFSTTTEQVSFEATGTILDYYGDRGIQYYVSWPYFLENPIAGIGLGNWINYSPFKLVCHSEYMVQYLEGGLISFTLYCLFWIGMFKRLKGTRRNKLDLKSDQSCFFLSTILMSIIFANSVLWTYDMYCIFIVYALVFGFCQTEQKNANRIISLND